MDNQQTHCILRRLEEEYVEIVGGEENDEEDTDYSDDVSDHDTERNLSSRNFYIAKKKQRPPTRCKNTSTLYSDRTYRSTRYNAREGLGDLQGLEGAALLLGMVTVSGNFVRENERMKVTEREM
ncbi:hypothetical protein GWI33_002569 [Rhynchophorus ferrugineus]|uniref:Uncharacterized protein n=1 Tax=Rhynchophorus ferrugineus TaxID=354439 RepID=A0A834IR39_RHYFE|nr:hypothetical protein GWI33_002569 [Rhynchophorus ferrugineus]